MLTTRLSSKGQVIIPKMLRETHGWQTGLEFYLVETTEGLLLKPLHPFPQTQLEDLVGCTGYRGKRKTLADMEAGIATGARKIK